MFIAICEGTSYEIFSTGQTEEEAKRLLWDLVSDFLKKGQAAQTSEMSNEELEEYFGYILINTDEKPFGFLKG